MRTTQEILEYVDRIVHIGVDKMETRSQFALIDLQPVSDKLDENCGKMLAPLIINVDKHEHEGVDGDGI
jgi:hypothetical protein